MARPLRSFLSAPATDLRKVDESLSFEADAVVLDLEDPVAVADKVRARSLTVDVLGRVPRDRIYVRINGLATPWVVGDLLAVVGNCPAGIMLPKAECAEEVRRVDWLIGQLEREYDLPEGRIELMPIVESARGLTAVFEVARSCSRVRRLAFAAVNYTLDMGTALTDKGAEIDYARTHIAVASRGAGIGGPIDTAFVDVKDEEGLRNDCKLARELGFSGKLVIHPAQISPVNEIFSPAPSEIEYALKVVRAFEQAEAKGAAAVRLDGNFIAYPLAAWARRTLDFARTLGLA